MKTRKQKNTGNSSENRHYSQPSALLRATKNGTKKTLTAKSFLFKALATIIILSGSVNVSSAQFHWGVKLGANASTQSKAGNIYDNDGLKAGFNAGVIALYQMNDWFAFKSGLNYELKGRKYDSPDASGQITENFNYLVLPLKPEFSAGKKAGLKKGQRLFFATGPYAGYLLNAEQKIGDSTKKMESMNDVDFGWSFELGYKISAGRSNALRFSLNYDMGITDVSDENAIQNKTLSLNCGYLF
ncbi:Outer membrane protein beta-barrel domain-containing protein [Mariniphaga anaerophila]|uniref:Outer membrane protein beta-barrel domain-containing protein n=1 Tax=Mariniphaga anaerophila TaxID=1484053 RepID=A0A1M5AEV9_9BACT|nr:porin family protein [Mariniphaga anaerophila]SHF28773.1 Outer membrane protein beta-barrel domain-containing protein [Mariniphaga anaerophila]